MLLGEQVVLFLVSYWNVKYLFQRIRTDFMAVGVISLAGFAAFQQAELVSGLWCNLYNSAQRPTWRKVLQGCLSRHPSKEGQEEVGLHQRLLMTD